MDYKSDDEVSELRWFLHAMLLVVGLVTGLVCGIAETF